MGAAGRKTPKARMLLVALAIGSAGLAAGQTIRLGRTLPPPPPPGPCLVFKGGGLRPLDYVDNLETCGARLEVLYLRDGQPVVGAYGGLRVFADGAGIDAASLHGPRQKLVSPLVRRAIDRDIERLLQARRRAGVIALDIGSKGGSKGGA